METYLETNKVWDEFLSTNPSMEERYKKAMELHPNLAKESEYPIPSLDILISTIRQINQDCMESLDPLSEFESILMESDEVRLRLFFNFSHAKDLIYQLVHFTECSGCLARGRFKWIWQIIRNYEPRVCNIDWSSFPQEMKICKDEEYQGSLLHIVKSLNNRFLFGAGIIESLDPNFRDKDKKRVDCPILDLSNLESEIEENLNVKEKTKGQ